MRFVNTLLAIVLGKQEVWPSVLHEAHREFNMDASTLLQEVGTLFSERSFSEEGRTKRLLEIKDVANIYFASATEKCKESKSGLIPCHFAQLQFPPCQINRENALKPARYIYSKNTI